MLTFESIMGNPISKVRAEAKAADETAKRQMEERMNILEKMVNSHLTNQKHSILEGESDDQEIHSGTVVARHQQINITESSKESQQIKDAIGDFFSGDFMGGLEKIVQLGAEAVLGNVSMGEHETTDMFIVWSDNALLRCDAYYYRWNFSAKGVINVGEGVVGVLLVKRVIDMTKTDPQVLTHAITEQANRQGMTKQETLQEIDTAVELIRKVVSLQAEIKNIEAGGETTSEFY